MNVFKFLLLFCLTFIISNCCVAETERGKSLTILLQTCLDEAVKETKVNGAVLLIKTPSFQWIGSSGYTDSKKTTVLKPSDKLRIASMTKTFVSVVVLKLAEEGKLNLDTNIKFYLPEPIISRIPYGYKITIRQLLNMTSGIRSYTEIDSFNDAVESIPYRTNPWTPEEILKYVYPEKPMFSPGKGWDYSNTNYILLEMIIKNATGKSLAFEMRRIIHSPLHLEDTFMEIQEPRKGGFGGLTVKGYDENGKDVTKIQDGLGLGDGGLISNTEGLSKFLQALLEDKILLNENSLKEMLKFHPEENYGLGIEHRSTGFGEALGHSGGSSGFEGDMLYLPKIKTIFVIITNKEDSGICELVFDRSMKILQENGFQIK